MPVTCLFSKMKNQKHFYIIVYVYHDWINLSDTLFLYWNLRNTKFLSSMFSLLKRKSCRAFSPLISRNTRKYDVSPHRSTPEICNSILYYTLLFVMRIKSTCIYIFFQSSFIFCRSFCVVDIITSKMPLILLALISISSSLFQFTNFLISIFGFSTW